MCAFVPAGRRPPSARPTRPTSAYSQQGGGLSHSDSPFGEPQFQATAVNSCHYSVQQCHSMVRGENKLDEHLDLVQQHRQLSYLAAVGGIPVHKDTRPACDRRMKETTPSRTAVSAEQCRADCAGERRLVGGMETADCRFDGRSGQMYSEQRALALKESQSVRSITGYADKMADLTRPVRFQEDDEILDQYIDPRTVENVLNGRRQRAPTVRGTTTTLGRDFKITNPGSKMSKDGRNLARMAADSEGHLCPQSQCDELGLLRWRMDEPGGLSGDRSSASSTTSSVSTDLSQNDSGYHSGDVGAGDRNSASSAGSGLSLGEALLANGQDIYQLFPKMRPPHVYGSLKCDPSFICEPADARFERQLSSPACSPADHRSNEQIRRHSTMSGHVPMSGLLPMTNSQQLTTASGKQTAEVATEKFSHFARQLVFCLGSPWHIFIPSTRKIVSVWKV